MGAMNSPAFSIFCDALGGNKSLIELDLRNNDINHVGASELASALKRNSTLRAIGNYIFVEYRLLFHKPKQIFDGIMLDSLVVELY